MTEKREGQGAGERDVEKDKKSKRLWGREGGIKKDQGAKERQKGKEKYRDGLQREREELKHGVREWDRELWGEAKNSSFGQLTPFLEHCSGTALPGGSRNVRPAKALSWAQSCTLTLVTNITLQSGQEWGKKSPTGRKKNCPSVCLIVLLFTKGYLSSECSLEGKGTWRPRLDTFKAQSHSTAAQTIAPSQCAHSAACLQVQAAALFLEHSPEAAPPGSSEKLTACKNLRTA